jgi:hypothetical protein
MRRTEHKAAQYIVSSSFFLGAHAFVDIELVLLKWKDLTSFGETHEYVQRCDRL